MKNSLMTDLEFSKGNKITTYTDGVKVYDAMLESIKTARQRIYFANFCFVSGKKFDHFSQELIKQAGVGVDVKIIADYYGSRHLHKSDVENLRQNGIEWVWFQKVSPLVFWRYNQRMHKKLLIIDGETGFTGGYGVADFWAKPQFYYPKAWRDTHFKLTGPIVVDMEKSFKQSWDRFCSKMLSMDVQAKSERSGLPMAAVNSRPSRGISPAGNLYIDMINRAETSIYATTAYLGPDKQLMRALIGAAERGVSVGLLVNGPYVTHHYAAEAGRRWYKKLLSSGIKIYEYQDTKIHSKLLTIDNRLTSIGSANMNFRSLYHDEEFNIVVDDKSFSKSIIQQFEADLKQSQEIRLEDWLNIPIKRKLYQLLVSLARYIF